MKKIRLLTSAEDTVLCELKYGMDISSNTLCAIKGKKKLAPTAHTQSSKFLWQRAKGWVSIYSQGRVFDPGSWHELGPMLRREPRAMLGGIGPDLRAESGQMAFVSWTKDPFSTSADCSQRPAG
jgi:hypothetical protein